jgi:hypothetical protein
MRESLVAVVTEMANFAWSNDKCARLPDWSASQQRAAAKAVGELLNAYYMMAPTDETPDRVRELLQKLDKPEAPER